MTAAPTLDELLALERRVWEALKAGDAAADAALLDEDFLGVYPSGFSGRAEHAAQLEAGPSVATYELNEARLVPVSEDAALLCYLAVYTGPLAPEGEGRMYVSSLWKRRAGGWVNLFSQDTSAQPGLALP